MDLRQSLESLFINTVTDLSAGEIATRITPGGAINHTVYVGKILLKEPRTYLFDYVLTV